MKEKIIQILEEHKDVCVEFMGEDTAIDESNFEQIADEIIKLLNGNKLNMKHDFSITNKLRHFLYCLLCCVKFLAGWIMWVIIFLLSLLFSLITWNWKETIALDMGNVITEICGKSTWNCMMLNAT